MNYSNAQSEVPAADGIRNLLSEIGLDLVAEEICAGLHASQKFISPKFFYDAAGSHLYEEICKLGEYYPYQTEKSILAGLVPELDIDFSNTRLIELGSGDHSKISLLLGQLPPTIRSTITYIPIDISQSALLHSVGALQREYPELSMQGVIADFIHQLHYLPEQGRRVVCFFGSTLGNLSITERKNFLRQLGSQLYSGDHILLGLDMVKSPYIIEDAYNDTKGVTAQFNVNILNVVNHLIGADFKPDNFEHLAFYNSQLNRIEMHLQATCDMLVPLGKQGEAITLRQGETIHTENSHKFTPGHVESIGFWSGCKVQAVYRDAKKWYSLVHYVKR